MNFEEYYQRTRDRIDEALSSYVASKYLAQQASVANYIVRGGKRFRGVLACLVAQGFGASLDDALDAAVAIELIHSASLTHDDVIDADEKRRGEDAAWVQFGVARAILMGHIIICHALDMMNKYGLEAWNVAVDMWGKLARGVLEEVLTLPLNIKESFVHIAKLKTGAFFGGAAALGAIVAKKYDYMERMYEWGEQLGVLYQLADDLVDISHVGLPKSSGVVDLFEYFTKLPKTDLALLMYITDGHLILDKAEFIRLALDALRRWVEEVDGRLPSIQNEYFSMLREVPDYFVRRMLEEAEVELKW